MKIITVRDTVTEAWVRFSITDNAWNSDHKTLSDLAYHMFRAMEEANDLKRRQEEAHERWRLEKEEEERKKKEEESKNIQTTINH